MLTLRRTLPLFGAVALASCMLALSACGEGKEGTKDGNEGLKPAEIRVMLAGHQRLWNPAVAELLIRPDRKFVALKLHLVDRAKQNGHVYRWFVCDVTKGKSFDPFSERKDDVRIAFFSRTGLAVTSPRRGYF